MTLLLVLLPACTTGSAGQVDLTEPAPPCATKPRLIPHYFYLIFFDSNSSTLSRRAQTVLGNIVDRWRRDGGDFIELRGYTDTQEAKTGRPSLARERAEAAKLYLAAQGIRAALITTEGFGASRPLVPSNQAEPQNRRVEPLPRFFAPPWVREQEADKLIGRIWVRNHCFTPSRLNHAGGQACNAALTAS